jgi:hypothetical protein
MAAVRVTCAPLKKTVTSLIFDDNTNVSTAEYPVITLKTNDKRNNFLIIFLIEWDVFEFQDYKSTICFRNVSAYGKNNK